ncbi:Crp/Fnr family transcriptional regulator [Isoptericola variabilis]|uniref:Transcriptional regulator, Crp/Fnr family n=1 Tax=Isoptericola variabilis (strain 225) TaxID=743718 RepID=F6FSX6_ISOV2|nr:Crp/Fnr family transcriptional regulator [Isoptericola variabilis]AEG43117.1 transcriptional regulator, Crp/Fnr family [Isoptericola variabilis 225]TWH35046.1 CRP-like cAMP-binding protein [Isoptericola variabilis J7]
MASDVAPADVWPPVSFLGRVPEQDRARLGAAGARLRVARGTELQRQGTLPDDLLVLVDGAAEAVHLARDGHTVRMAAFGPGDAMDLTEVCVGRAALTTVRTLVRSAVLEVPVAAFRRLVIESPALAEAVIHALGAQAHDDERHRLSQVLGSTRRLVGHWILALAERSGTRAADGTVVVRCTQSELASWAGLSREAVVKHLHALRADGLVATGRNHVTVLDVDRLRAELG